MAARNVVPFRRRSVEPVVVAVVGGPVDEVRVTLAIYSENLDPDEVSRALGVQPTRAHRRGDRFGPRSPEAPQGAWFLRAEGDKAEQVAPVIERLLRQLPEQPDAWSQLRTQHEVQIRFGLHMSGWNEGLVIPPELVDRMASMGATLCFDIYAHGDGE